MNIQSISNCKIDKKLNIPSIISNKELDNLFLKNKFFKDNDGSLIRGLSVKDMFLLKEKTGKNADFMTYLFIKPFTKDNKDAFKGFLTLGKTKDFVTKNFIKMFTMFSILNKNSGIYNTANTIYEDYKDYSELFRNVISNPPKKPAVYDAVIKYKGVDCGKITGRLRGTYEEPDKNIDKEIKDLKNYINTQVIKEPVTLYRGEGLEVLNNIKLQNGTSVNFAEMLVESTKNKDKTNKLNEFLLDNDVVAEQPAFMSTSMNPMLAKKFGGGQIFWELKTAPNTKAGFIEPLQIDSCLYEDEVLIQAGSKIRIKEAVFDEKSGAWHLKGEVFN